MQATLTLQTMQTTLTLAACTTAHALNAAARRPKRYGKYKDNMRRIVVAALRAPSICGSSRRLGCIQRNATRPNTDVGYWAVVHGRSNASICDMRALRCYAGAASE